MFGLFVLLDMLLGLVDYACVCFVVCLCLGWLFLVVYIAFAVCGFG